MRTHVVIFMIDAVRVICPWICCITLWMYKPSTTFSACFWGISFTKSSNIRAWLIHSCVHFCYSPAQKSCENWAWAGSFKSQQIFLRTIKGIGAVLRWIIDYREEERKIAWKFKKSSWSSIPDKLYSWEYLCFCLQIL